MKIDLPTTLVRVLGFAAGLAGMAGAAQGYPNSGEDTVLLPGIKSLNNPPPIHPDSTANGGFPDSKAFSLPDSSERAAQPAANAVALRARLIKRYVGACTNPNFPVERHAIRYAEFMEKYRTEIDPATGAPRSSEDVEELLHTFGLAHAFCHTMNEASAALAQVVINGKPKYSKDDMDVARFEMRQKVVKNLIDGKSIDEYMNGNDALRRILEMPVD